MIEGKRKRLLLALVEALGGEIESDRLVHIVFLFCHRRTEKPYLFFPSEKGAYSVTLEYDLNDLVNQGLVCQQGGKTRLRKGGYLKDLGRNDVHVIQSLGKELLGLPWKEFLKRVYEGFVYFYSRSEEIKGYIGEDAEDREEPEESVLITIGCEEREIDSFLDVLVRKFVKLVVDVRCISQSRNSFFQKPRLEKALSKAGIEYLYLPRLGIPKEKKSLPGWENRKRILREYQEEILPQNVDDRIRILSEIQRKKRVAILGEELEPSWCHRFYLARNLQEMEGFCAKVDHV